MIPLRDVIPSRTTPYITITIIALNAVAWLFELSLGERPLTQFLYIYGVVPAAFSWPTLIPWICIQIVEIPAIVLLGFWFLLQFLSAGAIAVTSSSHGAGGVAFAAHVAGFLVGAIGVFVFRRPEVDRWDPIDYY